MSLYLWLPLNGTLNNNGIINPQFETQSNLKYSTDGKLGRCLQFDGDASQILSISNVPQKTSHFSWCCWACQTAVQTTGSNKETTTQYLLSEGRDCGIIGFNLRILNGTLSIHMGSAENTSSIDTSNSKTSSNVDIRALSLNTWYHIAITVDHTDVHCYIDGSPVKSAPLVAVNYASGAIASDSYFTVGKMAHGHRGTADCFPFAGYINDVRVYDHCLSAKEVKKIAEGLILHYPLNQINRTRNRIRHSYIVNKKCSTFTYDEAVNTYTCVAPPKSDIWGDGFSINSPPNAIVLKPGDTFIVSLEVKPDTHCTWNQDVNNYYTGAASGNDHDDRAKRRFSNRNLTANIWNNVWFSFTARTDVDYSIYNVNSSFGIVTTDLTNDVSFQIRNIMGEIASAPSPLWTPADEDDDAWEKIIEYDCSGYGNNGQIEMGTAPSWNTGSIKYNGCYMFRNAYISLGRNAMIRDSITVTCWAYMDDWSQYAAKNMRIVSCTEAGGWNFEPGNGMIQFAIGTGVTSNTYQSAASNVPLSSLPSGWHMFTGTYDGYSSKIYLDGDLTGTKNSSLTEKKPIFYNAANGIFIGSEAGADIKKPIGNYFTGKLSDFRIYASALSASDIKELYTTGFTLDDKGNFFCGELIEDDASLQIAFHRSSALSLKEYLEFDSQNIAFTTSYGNYLDESGYIPTTNTNSCFEIYHVYQDTLQAGDEILIELDLEWSGGFDASNTDGIFDLYFQGSCTKKNDATRYWVINEYANALNAVKRPANLVLSSASGSFHYSARVTITDAALEYDTKAIGLRSNYSNGKGTVAFKNLSVRNLKYCNDGASKMRLAEHGTMTCQTLTEN